MSAAVRFAVICGTGEYVSHRRYTYDSGSHVKWGSSRTAQVWACKTDAEAIVQVLGGDARAVSVQLLFDGSTTSDVFQGAR